MKAITLITVLLLCSFCTLVASLESNSTGNLQLRDALNAAIVRLNAAGTLAQIQFNLTGLTLLPDTTCLIPRTDNSYLSVWGFPPTPQGTLAAILERGYVIYCDSADTTDFIEPVIAEISQFYNISLGIELYATEFSTGSSSVFQALNDRACDMTGPTFVIGGQTEVSGSQVARRQAFQNTCNTFNYAYSLVVSPSFLATYRVSSWNDVRSVILQNPQLVLAGSGTGDIQVLESVFPLSNIVSYRDILFANGTNAPLADALNSGDVVLAWRYSPVDLEEYGSFTGFTSDVSAPQAFFVRNDLYAPNYSPSCSVTPTMTPTPTPSPCASPCPSRGSDVDINFYFADMLRQ